MQIHARIEEIAGVSIWVEEALKKAKVSNEDRVNTLLTLEEVLVQLIKNAEANNIIDVRMVRGLYSRTIKVSCRGQQIDLLQMMNVEVPNWSEEQLAPEAEDYIRDVIIKSQRDRLNASYRRGVNHVTLTVTRTQQAMLINIGLGILLGVMVGLTTRLTCDGEMLQKLTECCFSPIYNLFLKAINMVIAPLVFFSLSASIAGMSDFRSLGRVGGKVMGLYLFTTMMATFFTLVLVKCIPLGEFGVMQGVFGSNMDVNEESISLLHVIEDVVPNSILAPFVSSNMLQVLFISVFFGLVTSTLGRYSHPVQVFLNSMNEIFSRFAGCIAKCLPVAVFGSMATLVANVEVSSIGMVLSWLGVTVLGCVLMYQFYGFFVWIRGINPIHFYRSFFDATMTAFSTVSSCATISTTMRCCQKMGLDKRIYSFSIPLGATINMDAAVVYFITTIFFLARICGVAIAGNMIVTLVFMILLISVAIPGIPGCSLICLAMLLNAMGIPTESMMLVLAVDPLIDPFVTAVNVTSDGAVTSIVCKSEQKLTIGK